MALAIIAFALAFGAAAMAADTASTTATTTDISTELSPTDVSTSTPDVTASANSASSTPTLTLPRLNIASTSDSVLNSKNNQEQLLCLSAYTADLFNTRTGHAAPGAVKIGTQSWIDCTDARGHKFEFKMAADHYSSLARRSARMPLEFASSSAEIVPGELNEVFQPTSTGTDTGIPESASTTDLIAKPPAAPPSASSTPAGIDIATSTNDSSNSKTDAKAASSTAENTQSPSQISTSTMQANIGTSDTTQSTTSDAVILNEDTSLTSSSTPQ